MTKMRPQSVVPNRSTSRANSTYISTSGRMLTVNSMKRPISYGWSRKRRARESVESASTRRPAAWPAAAACWSRGAARRRGRDAAPCRSCPTSGCLDDRVDLVRAVLDERANRHPAAAIVRAEKRPLQLQLVSRSRASSQGGGASIACASKALLGELVRARGRERSRMRDVSSCTLSTELTDSSRPVMLPTAIAISTQVDAPAEAGSRILAERSRHRHAPRSRISASVMASRSIRRKAYGPPAGGVLGDRVRVGVADQVGGDHLAQQADRHELGADDEQAKE